MFDHVFASPGALLAGAVTGLLFGFLLQKGGLTRFQVIVGQFLLRDFTVLKVMLTAVAVGAIGIYGMRTAGAGFSLHIKTATVLGNVLGGVLFGAGMAVLGYCPGTGVAAMGDGSRHAWAGVLGMIIGAGVYAEVHPWMQSRVLGVGDLGKQTLYGAAGLSPWWVIVAVAIVAAVLFIVLERWEHRRAMPAT